MRASKNSLVVTNAVEIYSLWKRRHFTRLTDKEVLLEEQYSEPASSSLKVSKFIGKQLCFSLKLQG